MKIQAIIFDWDGVIVDSMPFIAEGIQAAAKEFGATVSLEDVLDNYIQPRDKYYQSLGIDTSKIPNLKEIHLAMIEKYHQPAPFFHESAEVLRFLKEKGLKLAVASTAFTEHIKQQLLNVGLEGIFESDLIIGGEVHKEEKLKILAETVSLPSKSILYVGDLPSDIEAAKKIGVLSAGIERREKARKRLADLKPDYLFSSLNDLRSIIENQY